MSRIEISLERMASIAAYERACRDSYEADWMSFAGQNVNVAAKQRIVDALHPEWVAAGGHLWMLQDAIRSARRRYAKQLPEMVADIIRAVSFDDAEPGAAGAY